MKTARQAARQRRQRRRLALSATLAVTIVGVLAYVVLGSFPDRKEEEAGHAAATPVATNQVRTTTTTGTPSASATPSATGKPKPKPSASAKTGAARPSATATSQPPQGASTTSVSAGRIRPNSTYTGVATAYEAADGNGACLFGPSADLMIAAMNTTDYETSRACGAYVLVRAANGKSITVRITNECPLPCAPGQLDLSQQAFAKLADLKVGRIPITWQLLSPSTTETVSIRYKTGSSPHWCGIQAIGHRNPVARLEVRAGGGWRQLPRTEYNYFISDDGSGCGGSIRVTDIYGEQLTLTGVALRPNVAQPTGVQFARH
ncbi:expansin EXLX1 family cellulose-binding protein [Streptomyces phaeochromogenes]|uniref:expansin EXLX1 family cellulose-binding protein n=1 Tax=Streptomyces phaeochromogenes TaxID=1923 RepID=UPI003868BCF3|nr:expansin EXLX1 family cellulose-binding protein [Streptomyces phaeochromogenes]